MRFTKSACAYLLYFLLVWAGPAQTQPEPSTVDELLALSGLEKQIEHFPDTVALGLRQAQASQPKLSESFQKQLEVAMRTAFAPTRIKPMLRTEIGANLSEPEMRAALVWLKSAPGARITRLEEENSSTAALQEMQAWSATLEDNPPAPTRMDLIQRLDEAAGITEGSVTMSLNATRAMVVTMTAEQPNEQRQDILDRVTAQFEANREQHVNATRAQTWLALLYCYRSLKDEELTRYVAFAESSVGIRYHEVLGDALNVALARATLDIGQDLADQLRQQRGKGDI